MLFKAAMRKLLLAGLVSCSVLVLGCPKKKGDAADAAPEAEAAPIVDAATTPTVTAKNSADVARFKAETSVTDDASKIQATSYARTTPKSGTVVATLKPGTDVTKVSEYHESILVTFADPKDASTTLMGWLEKEAFSAPVYVAKPDAGAKDAGTTSPDAGGGKTLTCPTGMVAVVLSKEPVCRKRCTKDSNCKGGAPGVCANATTAAGSVARICTVD